MDSRNRPKIIITLVGAFIVVLMLIVGLGSLRSPKNNASQLSNSKTIDLYSSQTLARNIQCPYKINSSRLRYFTGTSVAEINLSTFKTKATTKEMSVPRPMSCKWNHDGTLLLLQFSKISGDSELATTATDSALSNNSWWVLSAVDGAVKEVFKVSGIDIANVAWAIKDNSLIGIRGKNIVKGTLDGNAKNIHDIPEGSKLVGDSTRGILIVSNDKLVAYGSSTTTITPVGTRTPLINTGGTTVVYDDYSGGKTTSGDVPHGNIYSINLADNKKTLLVDSGNNTNNYSLAQDSLVVLTNNSGGNGRNSPNNTTTTGSTTGGAHLFSTLTGNVLDMIANFKNPAYFQLGTVQSAIELDTSKQLYAITNTHNDLYFIGNDAAIADKQSPYPLIFSGETNYHNDLAAFEYDARSNTLTIYSNSDNSAENRTNILQSITDNTSDPNQVTKNWAWIDNN